MNYSIAIYRVVHLAKGSHIISLEATRRDAPFQIEQLDEHTVGQNFWTNPFITPAIAKCMQGLITCMQCKLIY